MCARVTWKLCSSLLLWFTCCLFLDTLLPGLGSFFGLISLHYGFFNILNIYGFSFFSTGGCILHSELFMTFMCIRLSRTIYHHKIKISFLDSKIFCIHKGGGEVIMSWGVLVGLHHLISLSAEQSKEFFNRKIHVRRDRAPISTFCQSYDSFLHRRELWTWEKR